MTRHVPFLFSLLLLFALVARPLAAAPSARKSVTKKTERTADAAPKSATPDAEEKAASTSTKSAAKKSGGANPAKSASSADEATPRPKKSATSSDAATSKARTVGSKDADGTSRKATSETEKASPLEAALPTKKTESDATETPARSEGHALNATIEPDALVEFSAQPPRVQGVIEAALALTKGQLTYAYGSADPESGGMDCSGTIYYLLRAHGFADVPRDSAGQYTWLRKAGTFRAVVSKSATSFEFDELLPGDLMFWSGTYNVEREIPVTHVMLYLGTEKKTRKRVMFGASDGRTYDGVPRWGVSVFDFKMPRNDAGGGSKTDFLGYGRIPGLRTAAASPALSEIARVDSATPPAAEKKDSAPDGNGDSEATAADASPRKKAATKKPVPVKARSAPRKTKS